MPLAAPVLQAVIGGGLALAGGAINKKTTTTGSSTSSVSPTMAPEYQGLQGQILQMMTQRLGSDPNLTGYTGQGVNQINNGFNLAGQTQENDLTRRGLATSPIAANVDATRNSARVGAISDFRNSIPLISRQLQTQDLGLATNLLGFGRGTTGTGTSTSETAEGGGAAGAITNLAEQLGYLKGNGSFAGSPNGVDPSTALANGQRSMPGNPALQFQPPGFSGWAAGGGY